MKLVVVIGRGHSGTRAISHTLVGSGAFMGDALNASGDLIPAQDMYEACRVLARQVRYRGDYRWDFGKLHAMPIDPKFIELVESYLASVLHCDFPFRGWKLPETNLAYPWIVRMFPDSFYIHWVRDPRDVILREHITDDLSDFGIEYDRTDDSRLMRAISWQYQAQIVEATPAPKRLITVRFEDFVLDHARTLRRLEAFLGMPMARIVVRPQSVGRYRDDGGRHFEFLHERMAHYGYISAK